MIVIVLLPVRTLAALALYKKRQTFGKGKRFHMGLTASYVIDYPLYKAVFKPSFCVVLVYG